MTFLNRMWPWREIARLKRELASERESAGITWSQVEAAEGRSLDLTIKRDLAAVLEALYEAEINFQITTFWDMGVEVGLGDPMNGFRAEAVFYPATPLRRGDQWEVSQIADWLHAEATAHFPGFDHS